MLVWTHTHTDAQTHTHTYILTHIHSHRSSGLSQRDTNTFKKKRQDAAVWHNTLKNSWEPMTAACQMDRLNITPTHKHQQHRLKMKKRGKVPDEEREACRRRETEQRVIWNDEEKNSCGINSVISSWVFTAPTLCWHPFKTDFRLKLGRALHIFKLHSTVSDSLSMRVTIFWQRGNKTD